jgi:hypothetical protein
MIPAMNALPMNEGAKTAVFVLLAAALIGGAMLSRPTVHDFQPKEIVGKPLFPQFTDPLAIKSLEIVKFDAAGESSEFRVVEVATNTGGIWSIPSHDNYPADAKDQMGKVAEALTDLKVLDVIEPEKSGVDSTAFQILYGVIDPTSDSTSLGEGIGIKITLGGANNETLVNLIIGKEADGKSQDRDMMNEGGTNLRYVRIAGQSPVYVVSIDPSQFSTNFDQWIEKNLLDISTFDIKEFYVDEYSFAVELVMTAVGIVQDMDYKFDGDITLSYDASAIRAEKWSLARWMIFEGPNYEIYREQQLDEDKELDTETLDSMVSALNDLKIVSVMKKPAELASALREGTPFENITTTPAIQRAMLETGLYLVEVPDLRERTQKASVKLLSNKGDLQLRLKDGIVYNLRFGDLTGTESEIAADENTAEDSLAIAPVMGVNRYLFITAEFDPAIIPKPELKTLPEISAASEAEELEAMKLLTEAIEKANQREQERYDAEIASGKKRAAELSARFADWYYVIAEDVYKKIHLTQENVFREKTTDLPDMPGLPFDLPDYRGLLDAPVVPDTE